MYEKKSVLHMPMTETKFTLKRESSIGSEIRFPLPYTFFKMTSIHDVKKSIKVSDKSSCFDGIWVIIVLQSISYRFTKDLQVMEDVNYNYNCIYNCTLPQTFIYKLP